MMIHVASNKSVTSISSRKLAKNQLLSFDLIWFDNCLRSAYVIQTFTNKKQPNNDVNFQWWNEQWKTMISRMKRTHILSLDDAIWLNWTCWNDSWNSKKSNLFWTLPSTMICSSRSLEKINSCFEPLLNVLCTYMCVLRSAHMHTCSPTDLITSLGILILRATIFLTRSLLSMVIIQQKYDKTLSWVSDFWLSCH